MRARLQLGHQAPSRSSIKLLKKSIQHECEGNIAKKACDESTPCSADITIMLFLLHRGKSL